LKKEKWDFAHLLMLQAISLQVTAKRGDFLIEPMLPNAFSGIIYTALCPQSS
jgi:hypothetical protein